MQSLAHLYSNLYPYMATNLLTDRAVLRAKPAEKEYFLNDGSGLTLRVSTAGKKLWFLRYTRDGKTSKKSLGTYPEVSLGKARELSLGLRRDIVLGKDVNSSTKNKPALIDDLFKVWFETYVEVNRKRKGDRDSVFSRYNVHVSPLIGKTNLTQVSRGLIMQCLDAVVSKGLNRQANLLLAELRQMFTYGAVRDWISGDPTAGILKKDAGGTDKVGERVLSKAELCDLKVILCSPRGAGRADFKRVLPVKSELAVWLALSTMARSVEIASAKAEDIDLITGVWTVPADIAKNGLEHFIHLNEVSSKVFGILLSAQSEGYLFPGRGPRKGGHIQETAFTRELTDRQGREKPLKGRRNTEELLLAGGKWTLHDLRRTGATMLGNMGYDEKLIDLCLNHQEADKVRRTYQKQQRLDERKAAFAALGSNLSEILGGVDWLPTP